MPYNQISASELERQIFELEEIRVVIRSEKSRSCSPYNYTRKASAATSITDWINQRVKHLIGDVEVDVIDGGGTNPHGRSCMETVRNSYR